MPSNSLLRRIEWGDCDPAGIVFNPRFFAFFDHGTSMLIEAVGWPLTRVVATYGAVGWPLVATRAHFLTPCTHGEDVRITTRFARIGRSSFDVEHRLEKDGALRVEGYETRVWTARDPGTTALRSEPLPEAVRAAFNGEQLPSS